MNTYIGLALIIVAWIVQLFSKGKNISRYFILVYVFGASILALDALTGGLVEIAVLNLISVFAAIGTFYKYNKKAL